MLKLTMTQLRAATQAAEVIQETEWAKDQARDVVKRVDLGGPCTMSDPLGQGPRFEVTITRAQILECLAGKSAESSKLLADLGIELQPE